jgi:hypothetical protein
MKEINKPKNNGHNFLKKIDESKVVEVLNIRETFSSN